MPLPTVIIRNHSQLVTDRQVREYAFAIEQQVRRDFWPEWKIQAHVHALNGKEWAPVVDFFVVLIDGSGQEEYEAFHDVSKAGLPYEVVDVRATLDAGDKVSAALSHDVLEMISNPDANLWVEHPDGEYFVWRELCDPVQGQNYSIDIGAPEPIEVSNFVYRQYFGAAGDGKKFDHMGLLSAPFEISQDGYLGAQRVVLKGDEVQIERAIRRRDGTCLTPKRGSRAAKFLNRD